MKNIIKPLTKSLVKQTVKQLVLLDQEIIAEKGLLYSNDIWSEINFLKSYPKKWEFSHLILSKNNEAQAFIIATQMIMKEMHIHRVAVKQLARNQGLAQSLLKKIFEIAKLEKLTRITLEVNADNKKAIKYYQKYDFNIMPNNYLINYCKQRKTEIEISENLIIESDGNRSHVLFKTL